MVVATMFGGEGPSPLRSTDRLQRAFQSLVALKPVTEPRDLQDLAAVVVEVDELELPEQVFTTALGPQQRGQAFAVDEAAVPEVNDEVHDLLLLDQLLDLLLQLGGVVAGEIAVRAMTQTLLYSSHFSGIVWLRWV